MTEQSWAMIDGAAMGVLIRWVIFPLLLAIPPTIELVIRRHRRDSQAPVPVPVPVTRDHRTR